MSGNTVTPRLPVWGSFSPTPSGHGGNLRSAQIAELCRESGFEIDPVEQGGPVPAIARLGAALRLVIALRRRGIALPPRDWSLAGRYAWLLRRRLRSQAGPRLLLWEETSTPVPVWQARRQGFAVLALPHNLEALDGTESGLARLRGEVKALAMASAVICVAEEESLLLANAGVAAGFLPCYPPSVRRLRLAAVAERRRAGGSADAPWLILGTAFHPPTRQGMERLLSSIPACFPAGSRVVVAGHGTESLAGSHPHPAVEFRGTVTDDDFFQLLAEARGLLVHSDRGAGALSRITEAQVAGVPVIASRVAARSTRGYQGVSVYDTPGELRTLLADAVFRALPSLPPPRAAMDRFRDTLAELAAR